MTNDLTQWVESLLDYCNTYNIPINCLNDILEDQKVLPMIRGKASEYNAMSIIKNHLDSSEWDVIKLNLNPQRGKTDVDIKITHKRTDIELKAETKNAVRASFSMGSQRTKIKKPHFKVKCHKSRSNLTKQKSTNDRYNIDDFDILLCNVSNSIFKSTKTQKGLHLIDNTNGEIPWLKNFYNVADENDLIKSAYNDWRICVPSSIAETVNGEEVIPRTPYVQMENDPNWFAPDDLESHLQSLVQA